jgi:thioredoxin-related protein
MKKLILLFCFIVAIIGIQAQNNKANTGMPPYRILKTDSTYSTPANLKKNRRVMLIYFSPDCPHCQRLMYEMKPKMNEFGDTQIVMITWSQNYDIRAIKVFYRDFGLSKYPNIIVGTEGYSYTVQKYFNIQTTPYIAIYNKEGKMTQAFDKETKLPVIIAAVKKAE